MIRKLLSPAYVLAAVGIAIAGYAAYSTPAYLRSRPTGEFVLHEDRPNWMEAKACVPPGELEHELDRKALQAFVDFREEDKYGISWAAFVFFGHGKHRREGNETVRVCPEDATSEAVAEIIAKEGFWRVRGFPGYHDIDNIRIARSIGPRQPDILAFVSETAFADRPVTGDRTWPTRDLRPLARTVLAEYGAAAAPWSERAFAAMGSEDRLGTTAAQLGVATRHPGAMEQTEQLLDRLLAQYPTDPIPDHAWMRFYELAYALAAAGPEAKPFAGPITRMTCRTVQVWAPPFGNLALPPDEMNRVLKIVGAEPCSAKPSKTDGRKVP